MLQPIRGLSPRLCRHAVLLFYDYALGGCLASVWGRVGPSSLLRRLDVRRRGAEGAVQVRMPQVLGESCADLPGSIASGLGILMLHFRRSRSDDALVMLIAGLDAAGLGPWLPQAWPVDQISHQVTPTRVPVQHMIHTLEARCSKSKHC